MSDTAISCEQLATKEQLDEVKEEIQELRNQLNFVIGERENGGHEEVFVKGNEASLIAPTLAFTLFHLAKKNAPKAILDIVGVGGEGTTYWQALSTGAAKLKLKLGNGSVQTSPALDQFTKVSGAGGGGAAVAASAGGGASGASLLLMFALNLAASVGLSLANLKITSMYADANERNLALNESTYNGLTSFLSKQNNRIDDANTQIALTQQELEQERANTLFVAEQLGITNTEVNNLRNQLSQVTTQAQETKISILETKNQIAEYRAEGIENMEVYEASVQQTLDEIVQIELLVEQTNKRIKNIEDEIVLINDQLEKQESRITNLEDLTTVYRSEFLALQLAIEENTDLTEDRLNLLETQVVARSYRLKQYFRSGSSTSGAGGAVAAQNGTLELANKLTSSPIVLDPVTNTDLVNSTDKFTSQFTQLLEQLQPREDVTPEQLEALRTGIKEDFNQELQLIGIAGLVDNMVRVRNNVTPDAISTATQTGICKSLNGGGCPGSPGNPNPTQGLGGMQNSMNGKLDLLNATLNGGLGLQNTAILNFVKNTNQVVNHGTYGLLKMKQAADIAWEATRADKVLNAASTVMAVHNGIMLSNNLGVTIGEASSVALNAIGIQDSNNNPIDVNTIVKAQIDAMVVNAIGEEQAALLTTKLAKANRIYQAGANIIDTTKNLFDSAHSIAGVGIEHTGKIGNALRDAGVVAENAYEEMVEKVNPQSGALRKIQKFRENAESIEDVVSTIAQVSGDVVEIKDNFEQLESEKKEFLNEIKVDKEEKALAREETKEESTVRTDINSDDFERATVDE